jgi:hypothetical protein
MAFFQGNAPHMSRDGKVMGARLGRIPWLGKSSVQMDAKRAFTHRRTGGVTLIFWFMYVSTVGDGSRLTRRLDISES